MKKMDVIQNMNQGVFSLNRPHWADSVIELPCLSVVLCVVLRN